jgi:hypothetical protein
MHVQTLGSGKRRNLLSAFYVKDFEVRLVWDTFVRVQKKACAWLLSEQYQSLKVRTRINMRNCDFCGFHEVIFCVMIELCCCALLYAGNLAFCIYEK